MPRRSLDVIKPHAITLVSGRDFGLAIGQFTVVHPMRMKCPVARSVYARLAPGDLLAAGHQSSTVKTAMSARHARDAPLEMAWYQRCVRAMRDVR